jgi:sucrose-6-phosphate hydrolase SacC (GH32 family)
MLARLLAFWKHRNTPTVVHWDDTNMRYTPRGERQEGAFIAKSLVHAWIWGQVHTFFNPRGAAYLMLAPHTA